MTPERVTQNLAETLETILGDRIAGQCVIVHMVKLAQESGGGCWWRSKKNPDNLFFEIRQEGGFVRRYVINRGSLQSGEISADGLSFRRLSDGQMTEEKQIRLCLRVSSGRV